MPDILFPAPDQEGVDQIKELVRERLGREITQGEAHEALYRVMRYLYLLNFPEPEQEFGADEEESFSERHASREANRKAANKKACTRT